MRKEAKKNLILKKSLFRHYCTSVHANSHEDDRTIMMRIIFDKCDPKTMSDVKNDLAKILLEEYGQNAPFMLDAMQLWC